MLKGRGWRADWRVSAGQLRERPKRLLSPRQRLFSPSNSLSVMPDHIEPTSSDHDLIAQVSNGDTASEPTLRRLVEPEPDRSLERTISEDATEVGG